MLLTIVIVHGVHGFITETLFTKGPGQLMTSSMYTEGDISTADNGE